MHRLGRAGRRVSGGLGSDLKLVAPPCLSSFVSWFAGFLRTSCTAGWRSNGDASSGSGETLDRWCRSRCWRRLRRRSPSGGRHRDPLLAFHPMVPGESLKSLDWVATALRRRLLLEGATLGVQGVRGSAWWFTAYSSVVFLLGSGVGFLILAGDGGAVWVPMRGEVARAAVLSLASCWPVHPSSGMSDSAS